MASTAIRRGPRGGLSAKPIAQLNHRHQQLINWLILNPDKTLTQCARELKYTQASLSRIIHSDMFQEMYRARAEEAGALASHTIVDKLKGVAALALERAQDILVQPEPSERFVGDTLRTTLGALGYGPSNGTHEEKHVHLHLTPQDLEAARARVAQKAIEARVEP
jgi:hypothetical protein